MDLIETLYLLKRDEEAEENALLCVKQYKTGDDFYWLGVIYGELKKKDEMIQAFETSIKI